MPLSFEEKSRRDSSAEKDAPDKLIVAMNCSIVYCFEGHFAPCACAVEAAVEAATSATTKAASGRVAARALGMRAPPFWKECILSKAVPAHAMPGLDRPFRRVDIERPRLEAGRRQRTHLLDDRCRRRRAVHEAQVGHVGRVVAAVERTAGRLVQSEQRCARL